MKADAAPDFFATVDLVHVIDPALGFNKVQPDGGKLVDSNPSTTGPADAVPTFNVTVNVSFDGTWSATLFGFCVKNFTVCKPAEKLVDGNVTTVEYPSGSDVAKLTITADPPSTTIPTVTFFNVSNPLFVTRTL